MTRKTQSLRVFGRTFPGAADRIYRVLAGALQAETFRSLFVFAPQRVPVGHPPEDTHPGLLRGSQSGGSGAPRFSGITAGGASSIPGIAEAQSILATHRVSNPVFLTYDAADQGRDDSYAAVIFRGRKADRNGVMRGSLQLRGGMDELLGAFESTQRAIVVRRALVEADKALP